MPVAAKLPWSIRVGSTFALLALVFVATRPALAELPGLTLTYSAPAGCPGRAEVEQNIEKLLGQPSGHRAARLEVEIEVSEAGDGRWSALVVTGGAASGSRRIDGGSCASVTLASAVVIAQAIQPALEEPAAPPREKPAPPRPTPEAAEPVSLFVSAVAGTALGSLPGVAPELGLGFGVGRARWLGELRVSWAPTQSIPIAGTSGVASIDRWALAASGCFALIATRANTSAVCLGAGVERYFGQARGVSRPESRALLLLSPSASLRSATRLADRVALVLNVTGMTRPYHPRFVIDGTKPVYQIPVVGASLLGGLELAF